MRVKSVELCQTLFRAFLQGSVHITTPEEIENGGFTLKTHEMFENTTSVVIGHFAFVLEETSGRTICFDYRNALIFELASFSICFLRTTKAGVFKLFRLKSVFEKLRFRDGLVWTVGLTVEIKLRFQISQA